MENVFVTSEVSKRSPDNTKHGQLNQPVNFISVNFEQVLVACGERVLLQTATVPIQKADGSEKVFAKVLLDSVSHSTFDTDQLAKQLQLNSQRKIVLSISTFVAKGPQEVSIYVVHFNLLTKDGSCLPLHVNVVNQITGPNKRGSLQLSDMDFLLSIAVDKLADTILGDSETHNIDLLIGLGYFGPL